ncbi:MAG: potassium channel protein [Thermodesulfovibrionales bacterium]
MRSLRRQLILSLLLILFVMAFGTLGYVILEGWGLFDSIYMTVITITTIGFKEVHELSPGGKAFTVVLIFSSVGAVFYTLNNATRMLLEGELRDVFGRKRLQKRINGLSGHYIVCGHGRMGRIICRELLQKKAPFVAIEREAPAGDEPEEEYPVLRGDATRDEVLRAAGIERARGLITVLPTDAENLYVVLSARGLNPGLKIVARAVEEASEAKLLRAGADKALSPYHIGGIRIAHTVLKPAVVDFIEFTTQSGDIDLRMEEIQVSEGSRIAGRTIEECGIGRELGVIVVAVRKPDGFMKVNPTYRTVISATDTLVVIGEASKLEKLEGMAAA